ncbi:MAG: FMN-binding protein [Dehalococcoidales bacterium]|nr:FMN-binding protein [Dehalococcoidales bacterium]
MKNKLKQFYPVIFITIIVLISITLLAVTDSITSDQRESQTEKKIQDMLTGMFPEMNDYELEEDIYIILDGDTTIGYAYIAEGKGYDGYIDILVGLENETTIKGISVISHSESPGLGARITEDDYKDQYNGMAILDSDMRFNGGKIDAITGATISSQAVADAVRTTALEKVQELFGEGGGQN